MHELVAVKDAARTMWATGDYDAMMRQEGLYEVGARLVRQIGVTRDEAVLDVACGTGNAAIPAAQAGGRVTGLDLTPELLAVARRRADAAGVEIAWTEGDAEDLPFGAGDFDVVLSTFGCMFAPRHEVVADELARVLRRGGRLGLATWTPEGVIGEFFRTVAPYLPPPPALVDPPLAWGEEARVRELFEGTGVALDFAREVWDIPHRSVDAAVTCYTTMFGPVAQARALTEADGRWPQLRADLAALFARHNTAAGAGLVLPAEYLVVTGHKRR
jgi:SAM-dependent methyltransferase